MTEEGKKDGFGIVYAQGSEQVGTTANQTLLDAAVAAVKGADAVVLSLGLGK